MAVLRNIFSIFSVLLLGFSKDKRHLLNRSLRSGACAHRIKEARFGWENSKNACAETLL